MLVAAADGRAEHALRGRVVAHGLSNGVAGGEVWLVGGDGWPRRYRAAADAAAPPPRTAPPTRFDAVVVVGDLGGRVGVEDHDNVAMHRVVAASPTVVGHAIAVAGPLPPVLVEALRRARSAGSPVSARDAGSAQALEALVAGRPVPVVPDPLLAVDAVLDRSAERRRLEDLRRTGALPDDGTPIVLLAANGSAEGPEVLRAVASALRDRDLAPVVAGSGPAPPDPGGDVPWRHLPTTGWSYDLVAAVRQASVVVAEEGSIPAVTAVALGVPVMAPTPVEEATGRLEALLDRAAARGPSVNGVAHHAALEPVISACCAAVAESPAAREAEAAALRRDLARARRTVADLATALRRTRSAAIAERLSLLERIDRAEDETRAARGELHDERRRLTYDAEVAQSEAARLGKMMAGMLASRTWRWTEPLRAAAARARGRPR